MVHRFKDSFGRNYRSQSKIYLVTIEIASLLTLIKFDFPVTVQKAQKKMSAFGNWLPT